MFCLLNFAHNFNWCYFLEMPSCDLIILSLPKPIVDKNVLKWINESRLVISLKICKKVSFELIDFRLNL